MTQELTNDERLGIYEVASIKLKDLDASDHVMKIAEAYLAIRRDGQNEAAAERTMVDKVKELFPKMSPQDRVKLTHRGMFMGSRVWLDCVFEYQLGN